MQHLACGKPSSLHCPQRHAEHVGGRLLREPLIVEECDHLPLNIRQTLAGLVKGGPGGEILRLPVAIERSPHLVGWAMVGVVVGRHALGAEVVAFEVDELPANLCAGQVEKVSGRLHLHLGERAIQSQQRVLLDIIGRLPPPQLRILPQHPPREPQQPLIGMLEDRLASLHAAVPQCRHETLQLSVAIFLRCLQFARCCCATKRDGPNCHAASFALGESLPGYLRMARGARLLLMSAEPGRPRGRKKRKTPETSLVTPPQPEIRIPRWLIPSRSSSHAPQPRGTSLARNRLQPPNTVRPARRLGKQ